MCYKVVESVLVASENGVFVDAVLKLSPSNISKSESTSSQNIGASQNPTKEIDALFDDLLGDMFSSAKTDPKAAVQESHDPVLERQAVESKERSTRHIPNTRFEDVSRGSDDGNTSNPFDDVMLESESSSSTKHGARHRESTTFTEQQTFESQNRPRASRSRKEKTQAMDAAQSGSESRVGISGTPIQRTETPRVETESHTVDFGKVKTVELATSSLASADTHQSQSFGTPTHRGELHVFKVMASECLDSTAENKSTELVKNEEKPLHGHAEDKNVPPGAELNADLTRSEQSSSAVKEDEDKAHQDEASSKFFNDYFRSLFVVGDVRESDNRDVLQAKVFDFAQSSMATDQFQDKDFNKKPDSASGGCMEEDFSFPGEKSSSAEVVNDTDGEGRISEKSLSKVSDPTKSRLNDNSVEMQAIMEQGGSKNVNSDQFVKLSTPRPLTEVAVRDPDEAHSSDVARIVQSSVSEEAIDTSEPPKKPTSRSDSPRPSVDSMLAGPEYLSQKQAQSVPPPTKTESSSMRKEKHTGAMESIKWDLSDSDCEANDIHSAETTKSVPTMAATTELKDHRSRAFLQISGALKRVRKHPEKRDDNEKAAKLATDDTQENMNDFGTLDEVLGKSPSVLPAHVAAQSPDGVDFSREKQSAVKKNGRKSVNSDRARGSPSASKVKKPTKRTSLLFGKLAKRRSSSNSGGGTTRRDSTLNVKSTRVKPAAKISSFWSVPGGFGSGATRSDRPAKVRVPVARSSAAGVQQNPTTFQPDSSSGMSAPGGYATTPKGIKPGDSGLPMPEAYLPTNLISQSNDIADDIMSAFAAPDTGSASSAFGVGLRSAQGQNTAAGRNSKSAPQRFASFDPLEEEQIAKEQRQRAISMQTKKVSKGANDVENPPPPPPPKPKLPQKIFGSRAASRSRSRSRKLARAKDSKLLSRSRKRDSGKSGKDRKRSKSRRSRSKNKSRNKSGKESVKKPGVPVPRISRRSFLKSGKRASKSERDSNKKNEKKLASGKKSLADAKAQKEREHEKLKAIFHTKKRREAVQKEMQALPKGPKGEF